MAENRRQGATSNGVPAVVVGVGPSAISNWKARGGIPPDKFMLLERALAERGKGKPSPDLFGFEPAKT